jgi:hypothetical protein
VPERVVNIQHSSRSDEWYTPAPIVELARTVLGQIDLDPASDEFGNSVVRAPSFYVENDNGLAQRWHGCVFLNPPGGKVGNKSKAGLFWSKLMRERDAGHIQHAIFLAFSAEALAHTQSKGTPSIMDFPICVPAKRVRFAKPEGEQAAPSHSNVIVYVPGTFDNTDLFLRVFSELGKCKR